MVDWVRRERPLGSGEARHRSKEYFLFTKNFRSIFVSLDEEQLLGAGLFPALVNVHSSRGRFRVQKRASMENAVGSAKGCDGGDCVVGAA